MQGDVQSYIIRYHNGYSNFLMFSVVSIFLHRQKAVDFALLVQNKTYILLSLLKYSHVFSLLVLISTGPDITCDRCDSGEIQDAWHIFTRCETFAGLRMNIFEDDEPRDLERITDSQLSRFIAESNYRWFPMEEEPEDPSAEEPEDPG